jgi:hypothetical protein
LLENKTEMKIILLDIDGVLLQPGGYREAVKTTIDYFTQSMGLGSLLPTEEEIGLCESLGITNEWDIVPIFLAIFIEQCLEQNPWLNSLECWEDTIESIKKLGIMEARNTDSSSISKIGQQLIPGMSPSLAILEIGLKSPERSPFPKLSQQPFFRQLFAFNKDIAKSYTTEIFQNFVLGSQVFQNTYHLPAKVETKSYLTRYDLPLLSEDARNRILQSSISGKVRPVAYSARPSLPPRQVTLQSLTDYSPEAEMALELVGLPEIPLIAYGRLKYTAQQYLISTDLLIKPSPFQAMAAIFAAISANEYDSLQMAIHIGIKKELLPGLHSVPVNLEMVNGLFEPFKMEGIEVHIVEDSPIGLSAGVEACRILADFKYPVEISLWGVGTLPSKRHALEAIGARVYEHIDPILYQILGR